MQLSQRLLAVADLASAGHCLADVGTDHGYIPIYLMEKGNYERAIAMDVEKRAPSPGGGKQEKPRL